MTWVLRRALKAPLVAKCAAQGLMRVAAPGEVSAPQYYFLLYHSVGDGLSLELDIDAGLFRRQMEWLANCAQVVSYDDAVAALKLQTDGQEGERQGRLPSGQARHPYYVLTVDDGYRDFYTSVFPILKGFGLPATLFVTTGFVEDGTPYPMLSNPDVAVQPVTWAMLGEMAESGLVTVGAHTHTHPVLSGLSDEQVVEELVRPLELFQLRLGFRPKHFAYPRAVDDARVRRHVVDYYASAAVGGGVAATPATFDAYRIPRVPIRRSDGWTYYRAKLRGWLRDEEAVYDRLRSVAGWR